MLTPRSHLTKNNALKSSGTFPGRLPVTNRRAALDPHGMHREFPEIWKRYLREHFSDRRGLIMDTFGVDDRTVRAWLKGDNMPRGETVYLATQRNPEFFARPEVAA